MTFTLPPLRRIVFYALAGLILALLLGVRIPAPSCARHVLGPLGGLFGHLPIQAPGQLVKPPAREHPHVARIVGTIHGHYTPSTTITPRDTLPVIVDLDIRPGDTLAVIRIGADTVIVDSIRIRARVSPLDWRLFCEAAMASEADISAGLAWEPVRVFGVQAGPFLSVDLPDAGWLAGGLRVSRRFHSTLDAGGEIGWRIGTGDTPDGLHIGVSAGFAF